MLPELPPSGYEGQVTWLFEFLEGCGPGSCQLPRLPGGLSLKLSIDWFVVEVLWMFGTAWLFLPMKLVYCCAHTLLSWYSLKARCIEFLSASPVLDKAAFVS